MRVIKPSYKIVEHMPYQQMLEHIERCGRFSYMSHDRTKPGSAERFVGMIVNRHHDSVLEHVSLTVEFEISLGISAELLRHRHMSPTQSSTRYVNYNKQPFTVVVPPWFSEEAKDFLTEMGNMDASILNAFTPALSRNERFWFDSVILDETYYVSLLEGTEDEHWTPEMARDVLPKALACQIPLTGNVRAWREVLSKRNDAACHPAMLEIMRPLREEMQDRYPVLFGGV